MPCRSFHPLEEARSILQRVVRSRQDQSVSVALILRLCSHTRELYGDGIGFRWEAERVSLGQTDPEQQEFPGMAHGKALTF